VRSGPRTVIRANNARDSSSRITHPRPRGQWNPKKVINLILVKHYLFNFSSLFNVPVKSSNLNEGLVTSIKYMRGQGMGIQRISKELKVGVGIIYKVMEAA